MGRARTPFSISTCKGRERGEGEAKGQRHVSMLHSNQSTTSTTGQKSGRTISGYTTTVHDSSDPHSPARSGLEGSKRRKSRPQATKPADPHTRATAPCLCYSSSLQPTRGKTSLAESASHVCIYIRL